MMDMTDTLVSLLKTLAAFFILYIWIPSRLIPFETEKTAKTDVFIISLIHSSLVIILIVHVLAFIKLYETISLFIACIVFTLALLFYMGYLSRTMARVFGLKMMVEFMDMVEGKKGFWSELKPRVTKFIQNLKIRFKNRILIFIRNPFQGVFLAIVFGIAVFVRFHHSILNLYLGTSDAYVHLAWTKYLGANNIYAPDLAADPVNLSTSGVYPYGYHAIVSAINKLFFLDPYVILRFIGPLAGVLMVFSIFYFVKKNYQNPYVVWLAVFLYCIPVDFPIGVGRQISALPQEYSAIFFLPGLHFFMDYFQNKKTASLYLSAECLALTLLIHPYATVYLSLGYLAVMAVNIKSLFKNIAVHIKTVVTMITAVAIGVSPLAIGLLLGIPWNGSFGYVQRSVKSSDEAASIFSPDKLLETDSVLKLFLSSLLIIFAVILINAIIRSNKKRLSLGNEDNLVNGKAAMSLLLTSFIIYLLYRPSHFNLPELMDLIRTGEFLYMLVPIVFSVAIIYPIHFLFKAGKLRKLFSILVCTAVVFTVLYLNLGKPTDWNHVPGKMVEIPKGLQFEYDEAVYNYLKIKEEFMALQWRIIAPVEQYQEVLGYGWHHNLWEFVQAIDMGEKDYPAPSKDIFLFVEKIPLEQQEPVTEADALKPFPDIKSAQLSDYYTLPDSRRVLEAKAYYWAEAYRKKNKNISIFYDSEIFRVYRIEKEENEPLKLSE